MENRIVAKNIFSGVKILDLTRVFSGPFATRHFSDFGAQVIKIEPPAGDDSRKFPPLVDDWSGYFELLNRNKESIFLNLKVSEDLEIFYSLCKNCDVVVENFSSGVKETLKIDYPTLKLLNERLIYASLSGISETVNRKYYDVIAQAESGLISLNGDVEHMKTATAIVDAFSGMKLAFAISSALYNRATTGTGMCLNVSMKGSAFDLLEQNLIETSITHRNPKKVGNMDSAIAPFGVFKTRDGAIALAVGNNMQWEKFSDFLKKHTNCIDFEQYAENNLRIKNISGLVIDIESVFKDYATDELIKILSALKLPCTRVKSMMDVLQDDENYKENLLEVVEIEGVGKIVVPTGGIFFKGYPKENYIQASRYNRELKL